MTTIKQIAQDPRNALRELEIRLGADPGDLLKDMERLSPPGEEWGKHLPYRMAISYYDDEKAQTLYQPHVDECDYCKTLLETLHPTSLDAAEFASKAKRMEALKREQKRTTRRYWPAYLVPLAAAASIAMTAVALPSLQQAGWWPSPIREKQLIVNRLRLDPTTLIALETSDDPAERYEAARYYFAIEQPQLAYRQIGEGLELSGLAVSDAMKITTAADLPPQQPAPALAQAARRLDTLKATPATNDPARYLEVATLQAKLGLHEQSLKSIQRYLEAKKADPALLEKYSETALAKPSKFVVVDR